MPSGMRMCSFAHGQSVLPHPERGELQIDALANRLQRQMSASSRRPIAPSNASNGAPDLVFPDGSEILATQDRARSPGTFLHHKSAELRLAQMAQLRGDARRRVVRQLRELVERQPRLALPRAQQHVAKYISLSPSHGSFPFSPLNVSHRLCLLSRRSMILSRKFFRAYIERFVALLALRLIHHPRGAIGVFVIAGTSAARAHRRPFTPASRAICADSVRPRRKSVFSPVTFSTLFHIRTQQ